MEHVSRQEGHGDGQAPQAAHVVFHAGDRVTPGPVDAHNGDVGVVADGHVNAVDDQDVDGALVGQLRQGSPGIEQVDEGIPQGDEDEAHKPRRRRLCHGEPPGLLHPLVDVARSHGVAHHDGAGRAKANEEGEGDVLKGADDGHRRIVLIAQVGIDEVQGHGAHAPGHLVENHRVGFLEILGEHFLVEVEELPDGADEDVLLDHRHHHHEDQTHPGGDGRGPGGAGDAQSRQAELAENEGVVQADVQNGGETGRDHGQLDPSGRPEESADHAHCHLGQIGPAGDPQVGGALLHHLRGSVEEGHGPHRGSHTNGGKDQGEDGHQGHGDAEDPVDALHVLHAPILGVEQGGAGTEAELTDVQQPGPLGGHADGRQGNVTQLTHHEGVHQGEGTDEQVLNGHRQGQPHGHGPEDRVPPAGFGQSHGGPSSRLQV